MYSVGGKEEKKQYVVLFCSFCFYFTLLFATIRVAIICVSFATIFVQMHVDRMLWWRHIQCSHLAQTVLRDKYSPNEFSLFQISVSD